MRQRFVPAPGKVALVVEGIQQHFNKELDLIKPDTVVEVEKMVNPWALVVGIGAPRPTESGISITTDMEEGDRVAFGNVGRYLPLTTVDGQTDYIYVLPFEGVLGRVDRVCEKCNFASRRDIDNMECPNCPVIEKPTAQETKLVSMTR